MHRKRSFRWSVCKTLVLLSLTHWLVRNQAQGQTEDFSALGQQVVRLVREHFYDSERANVWASRHADYADPRTVLLRLRH
jgi:hypothetical protein